MIDAIAAILASIEQAVAGVGEGAGFLARSVHAAFEEYPRIMWFLVGTQVGIFVVFLGWAVSSPK